jgi:hypothetical protein
MRSHASLSGPRLALGILALLFTAPAWAGIPVVDVDALKRSALKGIESVYVMVLAPEAAARCPDLTDEQVQTDVEARLRGADIRIDPDASSLLLVSVVSVEALKDILYGFAVSVELTEVVLLARDKRNMTLGATWHQVGVGVAGTSTIPEYPRRLLADIVDRFIHAYREQNQKQ